MVAEDTASYMKGETRCRTRGCIGVVDLKHGSLRKSRSRDSSDQQTYHCQYPPVKGRALRAAMRRTNRAYKREM